MRGSLFTLLFPLAPGACGRVRGSMPGRVRFLLLVHPHWPSSLQGRGRTPPSPRLPRLWIPARHSGFKRKDVYSKEYRHAQHKLPDFSTSIRISQVERLLKALFPAVFLPNRCLYLKKCRTATEIRNFVINLTFCERKDPQRTKVPPQDPAAHTRFRAPFPQNTLETVKT